MRPACRLLFLSVTELVKLTSDSLNGRCQLIYRTVIDMSDADDNYLDEWMKHRRKLVIRDDGDDDEEDNYDEQYSNIDALARKALSKSLVDGPEIFKRVKFLSRWEDRRESRGSLLVTVGDMTLWSSSSQGVAGMANFQLKVSICVQLLSHPKYISADLPIPGSKVTVLTGFAGRSLGESFPIILIISESRKLRRRVAKVLRQLDFLRANSRFTVVTTQPSIFLGTWVFEQILITSQAPSIIEARRRLKIANEAVKI